MYPDPVLTANIYLAGHLDQAIFRIAAPFWRAARELDRERLYQLWLMRYGKGGEHLKVRVHGPADLQPELSRLLEDSARAYFDSLSEPAEPVVKRGWVGAPPIDAEDNVDTDHPDRSFLWTHYGRSHVSLGGKPLLDDDRYAALFTTCMARGCELVLAIEPTENGTIQHRVRQSTLFKALIGGLAALGFDAEKRAQYLAYHRDWLLRFILPKDRRMEVEPVQQLLVRFSERIATMDATIETLRRSAAVEWLDGDTPQRALPAQEEAWRRALAALRDYVTPLCADPDYHLDPFAVDPVFSPIFKVFHGLGNQLGLNLADEGFAHHILLHATAPKTTADVLAVS
jgi:hypothetical protein